MNEAVYYIHRGGQNLGPYRLDQVTAMLRGNQLSIEDLAALEGDADWQPLGNLIDIAPSPPPPVPVKVMPRPAKKISRTQVGFLGLFFGLPPVVIGLIVLFSGGGSGLIWLLIGGAILWKAAVDGRSYTCGNCGYETTEEASVCGACHGLFGKR